MNKVILITLLCACAFALIRLFLWHSHGHTPDEFLNDKSGKYDNWHTRRR